MTWQPVNNTIDEKPFGENLLAFFAANQTAALEWANGGAGLKNFVKLHNSATGRVDTAFPVLMISRARLLTNFESDLLESLWQVEIDILVAGAKADQATERSRKYVKAVESMLANIPGPALTAGAGQVQLAYLRTLTSEFDLLRRRTANEFLQIAVIGAEFVVRKAGY